MRFRRNQTSRKSLKIKLLERSRKGIEAKAAKRLEGLKFKTPEICRCDKGQFLGTLIWNSVDGESRKWIIKQGERANRIEVSAKGKKIECGWDKLMSGLRKHLAVPKKVLKSFS